MAPALHHKIHDLAAWSAISVVTIVAGAALVVNGQIAINEANSTVPCGPTTNVSGYQPTYIPCTPPGYLPPPSGYLPPPPGYQPLHPVTPPGYIPVPPGYMPHPPGYLPPPASSPLPTQPMPPVSAPKPVAQTTGVLNGLVMLNSLKGAPLANAKVSLTPGGYTAKTPKSGRFQFTKLTPRTYTITISEPGYQTYKTTVVIGKGSTVQKSYYLRRITTSNKTTP